MHPMAYQLSQTTTSANSELHVLLIVMPEGKIPARDWSK